ncbi:dolichyl-phosphate-mannose--protein mannosyltransferase [Calothrix sp. NIES-3974]|uniref:dolichyl-phosphate-mannose--protein mannosyltransferase n=1 Tax=Calothrix sp. NIES-3974 TaxID=2005462 RepID=UPI000B603782|nr:phospholipid carrier-dependent glycosyltransferase [Calothrix sp. NIES-3974]BAZ06022.1 glycosyl transferase family protein [Calothrix sp. NIES-3974]
MTKSWFKFALLGIFLFALACRFWGLARFNTLVFDEVYYAKFGNNYLTHVPFFDGHPPLGKLIIAGGIWLGSHVPWWQDDLNGLTGSLRSPMSYRWLNALLGSFIPVLLAGIAYQLSHRRSLAIIAGGFAAVDGIFLVEARYALINQYIVIFGLLAHFCFLLALNHRLFYRQFWLLISGICFGAAIASKWNGLWYLLGIYLLGGLAWLVNWLGKSQPFLQINNEKPNPLQNLIELNIFHVIFYLIIIPIITYSLIWIPHLQLDTRYDFIQVHQQIFSFHERLGGNETKIHPYCAAWYTWPLMIRPMAYLYKTAMSVNDPLPVYGPPLPPGTHRIVYDVHAMGNPFLWWFGLAAVLLIAALLGQQLYKWLRQPKLTIPSNFHSRTWIGLYIVINYFIHLAPWVKVSRCVFIYHYMTGVVFAFLGLAWFVDWCLQTKNTPLQIIGTAIIWTVIGGFIFWLPIYLGLPLTTSQYSLRMWFSSWI